MSPPLPRFATTDLMIETLRPEETVYCLRPAVLAETARRFTELFPGDVLYAVKANPLGPVLDALHAGGIRHFDTASIREIVDVKARFPDATAYFMHPVKGWRAMARAWETFGVRHVVVDHADELDKVAAVLGGREEPPVVLVRVATPSAEARFNLSDKFGADEKTAAALLRGVAGRGFRPGLCFHVGSQCLSTGGFESGFARAARVLAAAGVAIECLDVGGGFPAPYPGVTPPALGAFVDAIRAGLGALPLDPACRVMCEPGRALVADGLSAVAQVQLRKDDRLYVTDGIYGTLHGTELGIRFPVRAIGAGRRLGGETRDFTLFGPTCDSLDKLAEPVPLPADIAAGDWLEFGMTGAYGPALRTGFNGFMPTEMVEVEAPFAAPADRSAAVA